MPTRLFAMLILTSWVRARGDEGLPPEPAGRKMVVAVAGVGGGINRRVRQVTLIIPDPTAPADEGDEAPRPRPMGRIDLRTVVVERENFDRWLFDDGRSEQGRLRHLENILDTKVELAGLVYKLTGPQRAKLRVAGMGDIKRFFDRVADRRKDFETERRGFQSGRAALVRLAPLSQTYQQGPFGAGSLFTKTLRKIHDDREDGHPPPPGDDAAARPAVPGVGRR